MAWNGSDQSDSSHTAAPRRKRIAKAPPSSGRGIWAALIVLVGAAVAAYFLVFDRKSAPQPVAVAEKKPAPAQVVAPAPSAPRAAEAPAPGTPEPPPQPPAPPKPDYKVLSAETNDNGAVVEKVLLPDGKMRCIVHAPPQVWDNAADQMIAMAISIKEGVEAAPMPTGVTDDEFRRIVQKDIVIKNDDSPEIKELKKKVRETRKEILDIMDETGDSFEQVLQRHHDEMNEDTATRNQALKELAEEDVHKYVTVMNAALQQAGIKGLPYDSKSKDGRGRVGADAEAPQSDQLNDSAEQE